jgi:transglutaminase-like putative cysteine protease
MKVPGFKNDREKWEWLRDQPNLDAQSMHIRSLARALKSATLGRAVLFAHLAHALARDGIAYVRDLERVGHEDLGHPYTALVRGRDDCDAKARLFCALCIAGGYPAELVPLWRGDMLQHVSARVKLDGQWMQVETTLARARLGEEAAAVPAEKVDGKWKLT